MPLPKKPKKPNKIIALRIILAALIILNMTVIFLFSEQTGAESDHTSGRVTAFVVKLFVWDFEELTSSEQAELIHAFHPPVRKLAHMAEFGLLGVLIFAFLLTWKTHPVRYWAESLTAVFLYACSDEWHQSLTAARGPQFSDVLIDLCGALISCSCILLLLLLTKAKKKGRLPIRMKTTHYRMESAAVPSALRVAVIADLHGESYEKPYRILQAERPDLILIPGDLMEDAQLTDPNASGYAFLKLCAAMAPTYYSLGNHEIGCYHSHNPLRHPTPKPLSGEIRKRIAKTGAILLDNRFVRQDGLCICGARSGINGKKNEPDTTLLKRFSNQSGCKILLCHHPEYFVPFIRELPIDLTVCGHAHGGQWRIFGRGIYAPGQGLFPKYTSGVIQNRCVISRGLGNHTHIPRIFNPREVVIIDLNPKKK